MKIKIRKNIELLEAPDCMVNGVIEQNTFRNPIYSQNEEHGRSNWDTDPYTMTYRYCDGRLTLPIGFLDQLRQIADDEGEEISFIDDRVSRPAAYGKLQGVELRSYQHLAVDSAIQRGGGVIVSPTGSGKSLIGLSIIQQQQQKALILVHRSDLARQWRKVISERLGIDAGMISANDWNIGNEITIGMIQTLSSRDISQLSEEFGLIMVDECHHLPAETFFSVIGHFAAKHRYGLSATLQRRDGLEPLIYLAIGPIVSQVPREEVEGIGATVPVHIHPLNTKFQPTYCDSWHTYQSTLSTNEGRADFIVDLIQKLNGPTLCLTDRKTHAEYLSMKLKESEMDHILAHGSLKPKERKQAMQDMKTANLTIGTTSLLGEGLDVPGWSNLILASPISSEIKLLQAIGRVARSAPGKRCANVYDLRDDCAFSGSSYKKRKAIYETHNFTIEPNIELRQQQQATGGKIMEVENFKPINSGYLVGSFDLAIPNWGISIRECKLFEKNGSRWVAMPSRMYEQDGEKKSYPFIKIHDTIKIGFNNAILKQIEEKFN